MWTRGARLKVQGQIVHITTIPGRRTAGATHRWGGRHWVLHCHIILLTVCRISAGDALGRNGPTGLRRHRVHRRGSDPRHGDGALEGKFINDAIVP